MLRLLRRFFDTNKKELDRLEEMVSAINALEPSMERLSDLELQAKTQEFRNRLAAGATLDDLLTEAFAVVREAAKRVLGMRHFDVQLMGGIVLHEGRIAEMKTGEGKTLVATLPLYLNALEGKGAHLVTVNDYLAQYHAEWMGQIYRFLGMTVGVIVHGLSFEERRTAYRADITYGTNNEFGFDYLRDNMVMSPEHLVQRELHYAIVDEVDSILIDEARTPLIISGPSEQSPQLYYQFARLVTRLKPEEHYTVDEKAKTVAITEEGVAQVERMLGIDNLYNDANFAKVHYLTAALKAKELFARDRDYVVSDGQVVIVDEFTGRLMPGRRYSDGLHQALEAKEGVKIERESQTLASITFQNFFRMYTKLAGMTGTAKTEEAEFRKIYGLEVVVIPTHKPMIRVDHDDAVYKTEAAKFNAVVEEIVAAHAKGQPVLVGTISIEKSERLSAMLKARGIPHEVLNAKNHAREAEIIKKAGQRGMVTIATNMAGRGTDIVLGEGVAELGGLYVIGTERHESRRIDNQLRGRAGRQGDPGASRFFVSLEDDLMRLFGSDRISGLMDRLGWEENQPIEHPQISKAIENAQKKVEAHNFDIREQVLKYDDVMNRQREIVYELRQRLLTRADVHDVVMETMSEFVDSLLEIYADEKVSPEDWDLTALAELVSETMNGVSVTADDLPRDRAQLKERIVAKLQEGYRNRERELGAEHLQQLERLLLLRVIDSKWMEHLQIMDDLREGIGLAAYGQKDPLMEYRFEGFRAFEEMMKAAREDFLRLLFRVQLISEEQRAESRLESATTNRSTDGTVTGQTPRRVPQKVGRNDPCPCGSGRKYKHCCGR
ncbi:MAG: preprotein translocase subunit SecA [Firmicutes bacterium]|nr:preprotein translocase subunit SecA [Bacillota bacterium]